VSARGCYRRAFLRTVGASGRTDRVSATDLPDEGVELLTDEFGVSHVYGTDGYSVGYGQGYVQARDRLFQLDLLRLVARGKSARLIGPSQLESDIEVRRDLYSEAKLRDQWEGVDSENRALIEGFADHDTDFRLVNVASGRWNSTPRRLGGSGCLDDTRLSVPASLSKTPLSKRLNIQRCTRI